MHYLSELQSIVFLDVDILGPRFLIHVQDVTGTPGRSPAASACCHPTNSRSQDIPSVGNISQHHVLGHKLLDICVTNVGDQYQEINTKKPFHQKYWPPSCFALTGSVLHWPELRCLKVQQAL